LFFVDDGPDSAIDLKTKKLEKTRGLRMDTGAKTIEFTCGAEKISFETGRMAKQAAGSVLVRSGDAVVLVACALASEIKPGQDFFPLTVDYRERTYAAGRIPGGFFKRETRPREKETLTSRLIDRSIRPLFPEGFLNAVQVTAYVISSDQINDTDILSINAASLSVCLSHIPFAGPIGGFFP
jgi:polyribonucleotide nucleotidyltransferase